MFRPLNNRILVKPEPQKDMTSSGILLPESKEKPVIGTVVSGTSNICEFKAGDKIIFSKFGYDEVVINEETFYVVADYNILGIF